MLQKRSNTLSLGNLGERYAAVLLKKRGYKIITTNFRSRFGEIDIIAMDGDTLCFVEVKTRRNTKQGLPEEAVDDRKLRKIELAAEYYIQKNPKSSKKRRIDVVAIQMIGDTVINAKLIKVT